MAITQLKGKESAMTIERIQCGPRMSQVVIHNKTVYLSGQVAEATRGAGVGAQTGEILACIDRLLAQAKTDKSHLLLANIWLTDMGTFSEMNKIWEAWLVPGSAPARATVVSPHLAASDYKIEIAVVAAQA
jgi:enamine deaminase RidA (YjgF/YER057c/UK114 family)